MKCKECEYYEQCSPKLIEQINFGKAYCLLLNKQPLNMNINEKISVMYKQYTSTKSHKHKKELYKAIKRYEGKRRKEKLEKEGVIV